MAMKFLPYAFSDDSSRLESILMAIDLVVFGDDSEVKNLDKLTSDENLKSECLAWRERFSKPDAERVKNKW